MRKRLGDGETPLLRRQLAAEDGVRDLEAGARLVPECGGDVVEPSPVMLDDRARPACRVFDRLAVSRVHDAQAELGRALERREVVAERIGPALG